MNTIIKGINMASHAIHHSIFTSLLLLIMAATVTTGCSSSEDEETNGTLQQSNAFFTAADKSVTSNWVIDFHNNDAKPSWTAIDHSESESSMIVVVKLQNELMPYSTDEDSMAVFFDGECHAVAPRDVENGNVYFVLNIYGKATEETPSLTLYYYSGGLHCLFTLEHKYALYFLNEITLGTTDDYVPYLMYGSSKYPETRLLCVNNDNEDATDSDDTVAAFVGDECRGVGKAGEYFSVYLKNEEETVQIRYYSNKKKGIYNSLNNIKLVDITTEYNIIF